jgi:hypothetical protein
MITFPEHAKVGRIVAKENFYSNIDTATKNLFQSEISRIIWEYKLASSTINLPAKKWPEIEVFRITLKNGEIPERVLKTIDSVIPYPILFLIEKGSIKKAVICYKEQNQKDENTAKVDTYFSTEWNDPKLDNIKIDGLDIDSVFNNFVRQIAGDKLKFTRPTEIPKTIKEDIEALKKHEKIQKQIDILTRKISLEPSLGKKQELAEERYELKQLLR